MAEDAAREQRNNGRRGKRFFPGLCAFAATAALWTALAVFHDFWFDLNDDVMMKELLSGGYTGAPETHNIQMLYPISALIAGLYRAAQSLGGAARRFDIYGAVLLFFQFGALYLVLRRLLEPAPERLERPARRRDIRSVCLSAAALLVPLLVMQLWHLVYVQYTVTCGMLAAAAAFLFQTMRLPGTEESRGLREYLRGFVKACLPSLLLIFAGYLLRSEMMLLLLPLVLVAALFGVFQSAGERKLRDCLRGRTLAGIGLVLLLMALGLGAGRAADAAAYRSGEWRTFRRFFDARTELYDYYHVPPYAGNEAAYELLGLSGEQAALLENYNFGLDESIDADRLEAVAGYAGMRWHSGRSVSAAFRNMLWNSADHLLGEADRPYNLLVLGGYVLLLLMGASDYLRDRRPAVLLRIVFSGLLLFAARSSLWGFILYGERAPVRITHSLYFTEFVILFGLVQRFGRRGKPERLTDTAADSDASAGPDEALDSDAPAESGTDRRIAELLLLAAGLLFLPSALRSVREEAMYRGTVNAPRETYMDYCAEHPENVYFTDVMSTVAYSEKMFGENRAFSGSGRPANYDLAGGWVCGSPLWRKKLAALGCEDMASALISGDTVFFVIETGGDMSWLTDWYEFRGISVMPEKTDEIGGAWEVYRIAVNAE
ncbi:hypothetical protein [Lachnoclostridium sp. Marseille-P6806]|uniref:hypothetical protein n=1 Tax=Lachnoclostridium sp. Marseille-P6806 TaxID=2364793 RepID=UPI0010311EC7|nr:hypothetical protein [Lachnoclostridium sp. Marseille-P6806]